MKKEVFTGGQVLASIKDKLARSRIENSIVPCHGVRCFGSVPPFISGEYEDGKMIASWVTCPQCGHEGEHVAGNGSDYSCLYNAVVSWNKEQMNLHQKNLFNHKISRW